jgi:hypothetical protein
MTSTDLPSISSFNHTGQEDRIIRQKAQIRAVVKKSPPKDKDGMGREG